MDTKIRAIFIDDLLTGEVCPIYTLNTETGYFSTKNNEREVKDLDVYDGNFIVFKIEDGKVQKV